jgi:fatty acid desaturase
MKGLFIISLLYTTVHTGRASPLPDIFLISLIAVLLLIATVTSLWEILKKENPNEVKTLDHFLIFVLVIVPFAMVIYFGSSWSTRRQPHHSLVGRLGRRTFPGRSRSGWRPSISS